MQHNKSFLSNYTFWYVIIGVLLVLTLFLPFRINVFESGYYVGLFGGGSYHAGSRKVINGFEFKVPFLPIALYFVTTLFISFSRGKATKVIALVFTFFLIVSLLFLLIATNFTLNFGGKSTALTGIGYYIMTFLSLIFIIIVWENISKTWNKHSNVLNFNEDLLDN